MRHSIRLLPALGLLLAGALVAETPEHRQFTESVRAASLDHQAGSSWTSDCYPASNGLSAITTVSLEENHEFLFQTRYFSDADCLSCLDWSVMTPRQPALTATPASLLQTEFVLDDGLLIAIHGQTSLADFDFQRISLNLLGEE